MARLSRLLSAVSLGIAATAALGAAVAVASGEYAPVHRTPTHLAEQAGEARVIVKFRARASILSAPNSSAGSTASGSRRASALGSRLGLALSAGHALGERTQVMTASGMSSAILAATLAADSDVEWAEVDHRRFIQAAPVDDPFYPDGLSTAVMPAGPAAGQWYLRAPGIDASGRNIVSSINIEPAWAITHGSASIVIGDVDTGITSHPDLDSKILTGYDFVGWGQQYANINEPNALLIANDGSLADADPSDPGDYVTAAENSNKNGPFYECNDGDYPNDPPGSAVATNSSWHGTQTAGILGASTNNGAGMAGTAYSVNVVPARALGKCGGYDSDIIAAAEWAGGIAVSGVPANVHPARVINMSLGGSGDCGSAYQEAMTALRNKGVVVVVAAGNDTGLAVDAPANCQPAATDGDQTPIVVAVAGVRQAGDKVGYSDIGPQVTIAAPAGNCVNTLASQPCLYPILTTVNSGTTTPVPGGGTYSDGMGNPSLGTSFATPLVSGTVALMLSTAPNLTNAQVVSILKSTARPFPVTSDTVPTPAVCTVPTATSATQDQCMCTTSTCGAGMLDAGAAVTAAAALSTGTSPTAAISPTSPTVVAGSTVTLSATDSAAGSGGGALTYQWSIPDGDTFVQLGAATGSSVVVTGTGAGTGEVQLIVTDARGVSASTAVNVTVTAAASTGGGGSGGGAANPAWLLALVVAGLLMGPRTRRTRR
jgi:serine protease